MPRLEKTERTLYKFEELSDEAKNRAIQDNYGWNVEDMEWWDYQYEDAERVGLKITGFYIDRGSFCDLDFITDAEDTAKLILKEHGKECDTYLNAGTFIEKIKGLEEPDDFIMECEDDFKRALSEDYLSMLRKEYEYLTGGEAIRDSLISNEMEFLENGSKS